jgi:hypothetical protein
MLREATELLGRPIDARDGRLGIIEDVYFDDRDWTVRYALVKAGIPFRRDHLLIEPGAIARSGWPAEHLEVWLSRREARGRIAPDTPEPARGAQFVHRTDAALAGAHVDLLESARLIVPGGAHLRGLREAHTYRLSAKEGAAGHVRDFIIDDRTWAICHVAADVDLFFSKKPVLIPPHLIDEIDPAGHAVRTGLTRHALGGAPRYQRLALQSRLYQMCLFDYYASATGAPLMRPARMNGRTRIDPHARAVDARMLLSTIMD